MSYLEWVHLQEPLSALSLSARARAPESSLWDSDLCVVHVLWVDGQCPSPAVSRGMHRGVWLAAEGRSRKELPSANTLRTNRLFFHPTLFVLGSTRGYISNLQPALVTCSEGAWRGSKGSMTWWSNTFTAVINFYLISSQKEVTVLGATKMALELHRGSRQDTFYIGPDFRGWQLTIKKKREIENKN